VRVAALLVRFVTKKFIGDYDPNLEKMYTHQVSMESEMVNFEILDTAGYVQDVRKMKVVFLINFYFFFYASQFMTPVGCIRNLATWKWTCAGPTCSYWFTPLRINVRLMIAVDSSFWLTTTKRNVVSPLK